MYVGEDYLLNLPVLVAQWAEDVERLDIRGEHESPDKGTALGENPSESNYSPRPNPPLIL